MSRYVGFIHKDVGTDYGVSFPDFPGLVTAGASLGEARAMAEEALAFHIDGLTEDGEPIPEPTDLDKVICDPMNRGAIAIFVACSFNTSA